MAKRKSRQSYSRGTGRFDQTWIITVVMAAFWCLALGRKALFNAGNPLFDGAVYLSILFAFVLGLGMSVYYFRLGGKPPVWPMLMIWAIPLSYLLSYFGAVSKHGALVSLLIHVAYSAIFIFGYLVIRPERSRQHAQAIILFSGYAVVLFGLLHWLGIDLYNDAVDKFSGEYRLMSVFQYANTYGAYLIALLLASLFVVCHTKSRIIRWTGHAMMPLLVISLMLTLSRGAWLTFPVLFVFILLFIRMSRQLAMMLYLVASGIPAMAVLGSVNRIGIDQHEASFSFAQFAFGLLLLALASALAMALAYAILRYVVPRLDRLSFLDQKRTASLWIPLGSVLAATALGTLILKTSLVSLFPDSIEQRVASINFAQHSVLERFSFYSDAFAISDDYPLFGAGGGAWNALYEHYQSYPYASTQVHSFLFQYLVEAGWFGLLTLLLILVVVMLNFIASAIRNGLDESAFVFFILAVSLILHGAIDFDLSYLTIGGLVFFSLGVLSQHLPPFQSRLEPALRKGFSWTFPVLLLLVLVPAIRLYDGHVTFNKVNKLIGTGQLSATELQKMMTGMVGSSKHPIYLQFYFQVEQQLYSQSNNQIYLSGLHHAVDLMKKYEPERRETILSEYSLLTLENQPREAAEVLARATDQFPWDLTIHEQAMDDLFVLGSANDQQPWDEALRIFEQMEKKMAIIKQLPPYQVQSKPFEMTDKIVNQIAKIHLLQNNPQMADQVKAKYTNSVDH